MSRQEEVSKEDKQLSRFEKFLNIVRGKVDIKNRLSMILNPENVKTSAKLTRGEVDFVTLSLFVAEEFPQFEPLRDYALLFAETSLSQEGYGVESAIRFTSAITESKLFKQLSIFKGEEAQKPLKGKA